MSRFLNFCLTEDVPQDIDTGLCGPWQHTLHFGHKERVHHTHFCILFGLRYFVGTAHFGRNPYFFGISSPERTDYCDKPDNKRM